MAERIYRVRFINEDKIYEIYARHVYQGAMYGFVVIEDILFGETSSIVVDPAEERLKQEFKHVNQTFIPMHAILRIDQVEKKGVAKISSLVNNVTSFPSPIYTPKGGFDKKD